MALAFLVVGIVLIVSAIRNSQNDLFAALSQDGPKFIVWAAAIFAIGALGFIPGLKNTSRLLLALIIVVIVLNNYQQIGQGFTNAWQNPGASPTPKTSNPSANAATSSVTAGGIMNSTQSILDTGGANFFDDLGG